MAIQDLKSRQGSVYPFSSASFLPHLLNFNLTLVERSDCSMSCSEPVADLAWIWAVIPDLGWIWAVICVLCTPPHPPTPPTPAHIHRDGPRVVEEAPWGAATGASSKGVFSTSSFPAAGRQSLAKASSSHPAP